MFSPDIFAKLATLTGQEIDLEKVSSEQKKNWRATGEGNMATFIKTAESIQLTIVPMRVAYSEAVWKATDDYPVVIWSVNEEDWVLVTKTGQLTARIADCENPYERTRLFHHTLVRRLGLKGRGDVVEAGIVQRSLPADSSSSHSPHFTGAGAHSEHGTHETMRPELRYFNMLLEDKKDIITLLIFSLFSGVLYLTVPLAVDSVVSNLAFGTQAKPYVQALFIMGQVVMACLILQAVITGFQYYISDVIQRRMFARTTADIAYRLPRTRQEDLDPIHTPELVNRFLDVVTTQKNTATFLLDGINMFMSSLIGMVLLSLYHPFLLVFVLVVIVFICLIVAGLGRGAVKTSIIESKTKYNMLSWFEEVATYPTLFKGPGGYELATNRANKLATEYVNARSGHFRVVIRQVTGLLVLSVIAAVLLLIGGAWLVISQQITLGQLVASEIIMGSIIGSLAKLGKKLEAWYDTMAAVDKLGHIFDLRMESERGAEASLLTGEKAFSISAKDISYKFQGESHAFHNLSFDYEAGTTIAVVGRYGSGVSALLDMFFGMREPGSGYITMNGVDVKDWKRSFLRQHVLLLRPDLILGTTITDNLRLGYDDIGIDEVQFALREVGLLDAFLSHPDGLDRRLNIGGAKLPKNQRVALLIARAIVQKPKLLMIDEIFDGLGEEMFECLSKIILSKKYPWTVLFATRRREHTQLCDAVIDLSPNESQF